MMNAVLLTRYGSSDDLTFTKVPVPTVGPNDALVKLRYTSINSADLDYIHGHPLVRFTGLRKPGYPILGSDLVGVVEQIGGLVSSVQVGDYVWADTSNPLHYGTFAEYSVVPATSLQVIPAKMNLAHAACLPSAGVVALQNIQLKNPPKKGDTALVNGAGGGIGTVIVQLLHQLGVEVTAVDKQSKHDMLHQIGARHTIDYQTTDYTQVNQPYDYVYDLICTRPLKEAISIVRKHGHFVMLGGTTANILRVLTFAPLLSRSWQKQILPGKYRTNNHKDLAHLQTLLTQGQLQPVIDHVIPLQETIAAIKALEGGNVLGKIVIEFN